MASPTVSFRFIYVQDAPYTQALDYDTRTDGQPVYMGLTEPTNAKGDTKWQIRKFTYDANGFVTDIQWANGGHFTTEWDERASAVFS